MVWFKSKKRKDEVVSPKPRGWHEGCSPRIEALLWQIQAEVDAEVAAYPVLEEEERPKCEDQYEQIKQLWKEGHSLKDIRERMSPEHWCETSETRVALWIKQWDRRLLGSP